MNDLLTRLAQALRDGDFFAVHVALVARLRVRQDYIGDLRNQVHELSTINSGATTITGAVSLSLVTLNPSFLWGFGLLCNGPTVVGLDVSRTANYAATIQTENASQAISGPAQVSGSFLFSSPPAKSNLTVTFSR